ncbi:MAG TPA: DUF2914 domain-containing protein [Candidatus Bathyarchaeia archaeon]|nr:DUF2914 domain-containing protein [Candidatus Bathyarchaeia archaeon]
MKYKKTLLFFSLFFICFLIPSQVWSQKQGKSLSSTESKKLTLGHAAMCEDINDQRPRDEAIVFSIKIGSIYCFTDFEPVPEESVIYHKWFSGDKFRTEIKLNIKPPKWSTFSKIRPLKNDKGPWRVEITDQQGIIFQTLRFSITD